MTTRKFNRGDKVGWRSDSEFTKSNRQIQSQKVVNYQRCLDGDGWEYRITNYMGWQLQNELEARTD